MSTVPAAENFRVNLRTVMVSKGLSQYELAASTGMGRPYVNRVLQGHTMPTVPQCERLADAVGVPLAWLFDEPEKLSLAMSNGQRTEAAGKK